LTIRSSSYLNVIYICKISIPNYTHSNGTNYFFPLVCIPFGVSVIQIAILFYSKLLYVQFEILKASKFQRKKNGEWCKIGTSIQLKEFENGNGVQKSSFQNFHLEIKYKLNDKFPKKLDNGQRIVRNSI